VSTSTIASLKERERERLPPEVAVVNDGDEWRWPRVSVRKKEDGEKERSISRDGGLFWFLRSSPSIVYLVRPIKTRLRNPSKQDPRGCYARLRLKLRLKTQFDLGI
jgi:hypothetical protein